MSRYRLRVHIRVMNRGQWDVLDDLMFSDEVQGLIGDVSSYVDGRSLVIDKTVSYSGFLFINPFFEIIEVIRNNVGECLAIGDYVDQGNRNMAAYVCEIGDLSESETTVSAKLSSTSISDIEAWVKARGKTTPQSAISTIKAFYGAEPQPTMQGPWSIEKEIELRHNVFSKASFNEIVSIAKDNFGRAAAIYQLAGLDVKGVISISQICGKIATSHGREPNSKEKELFAEMVGDVIPNFLHQVFWRGFQEPFSEESADIIRNHLDSAPQLAPSILDMVFCFIYADGKVEAKDTANLNKLAPIISMPMSTIYMAQQFGEDVSIPPIDYVSYVDGVDNDTVAYMAGSNGFMNVNLGGQNVGIRMISEDLSDDDEDSSPVNVNLNTSFARTLEDISNGELSLPTYNFGKSEKINELYFGVPDQCSSLSDLAISSKVSKTLSRSLKEKFLFLVVPSECEKDAEAYQDLPLSIHCKKSGLSENVSFLTSIWRKSENERKRELVDLTKRQLDSNGFGGFPIIYKSVSDKFAIVYAQVGKGDDNQFWCSYMVSVLYKNTSYSFMIYINAKKNEKLFSKIVENWISTISPQKPQAKKSVAQETTVCSEPKVEISNEELDAKILGLLINGERYALKELRTSDDVIASLTPQKLSAALRRMTQNGSLIKVDENNDSYYYSAKALYDKTVRSFNGAKTVEKYEELIKTFNLLGGHQDARAYVEKCREQIKEINYDAANKLMLSAKTPNDFKKAADAFKKLGTFRESEANLTLCNTKKQELENSNSYDAAVKKMNAAKTSAEIAKVVSLFEALGSYRDSKELAQKCKEKSSALREEERKQAIYNQAIAKIASSDISVLTQAATELDTIAGWRDTDIQAHRVRTKISDLLIEEERVRIAKEKKKKKIKIIFLLVISAIVLGVILALLIQNLFIPMHKMNKAEEFLADGNYSAAKDLYGELDGYGNSVEKLGVIDGLEQVNIGNFEQGINAILSSGVPVEITYELSGGSFDETKTLMLGYTLSTDATIVPLDLSQNVSVLSNENNVFLFTSKSEFKGLYVPTKHDYTFVEYKLQKSEYDLKGENQRVRLILIAEWKVAEYTITYHLEGGANDLNNPSIFTSNDEIVLVEPIKTGYTFLGWTFDGQTEPVKNVKIPTGTKENKEYSANWKPNTYHITFNPNGGTNNTATMDMVYDNKYTLPTPTKIGHTFLGWYDGSTKHESGISKISNNVELLAKWEATSYTITYNANGGTVSSSTQTVIYGKPYTLYTPTRAGYTFKGWYSGSDEVVSGTWDKESHINITAKWEIITYKITYQNTYGIPNSNPITYTVNDEITLANLNLTGNPFVGWYKNSSYTTPITKISKGTTGNITLYAKFTYAYEPIYNASDLKSIQMGKSYILMNNIDLGGAEWTPLGSYSAPFTGSFNGNGYKISNFKITNSNNRYVGLFGCNKGSICNLNVESFTISNLSDESTYAGGLVGYNYGGTISNCSAKGNVSSTIAKIGTTKPNYKTAYAGGLVGYNSGNITDSYADCSVIALADWGYNDSCAGGLTAYNSGAGYKTESANIERCYSKGSVTAKSTHVKCESYAGGLVAKNAGNVTNSYASVTVSATITDGYSWDPSYAGGLIASASDGIITNCYATGSVNSSSSGGYDGGKSYAGGLIASVGADVTIKNCYATGDVNAYASVSYGKAYVYVGGLYGYTNTSATISNCYRLSSQSITYSNSSGVSINNNTTGTTKTQAQIQTTSFHTSTLGWSTSIWNIISDAYPTLK